MSEMDSLSRRDFLKLLTLFPLTYLSDTVGRVLAPSFPRDGQVGSPGLIVIVLDALSALNLSVYGYPRCTSPNMERFAARSNVYHAHYSSANFTCPGTASLLAGTYPWTHRTFHYEGLVAAPQVQNNIFNFMGRDHYRLAYTQNPWADLLFLQFSEWLDTHLDPRTFSLDRPPFYDKIFNGDRIAAFKSVDSLVFEHEPGLSASPLLALIRKACLFADKKRADEKFAHEYPLGVPKTLNDVDTFFLLEDVFDGIRGIIRGLPPAGLAYLHLYPPHYPHAPRRDYVDAFQEGWQPPVKPPHFFAESVSEEKENRIRRQRQSYDAYVATIDEEFGRLLDSLQADGALDRNYVVLTSDHGEIHERGVAGHTNSLLYEPLIRIPLIVSTPGQKTRLDVHMPTSSIDLVPTLLALAGRPIPSACEGTVLPGLGGREQPGRSIYSIDAKDTHVHGPIQTATISLRKGGYKLIGYYGYDGFETGFELYDLDNDPEEMNNLVFSKKQVAAEMRAEIETKLREVNSPYLPR